MMQNHNTNDDVLFDRLVDGELSAEERRALLQSLDTRPDGWRRCALAFLESQSWGSDFRQLIRKTPSAPGSAGSLTPPQIDVSANPRQSRGLSINTADDASVVPLSRTADRPRSVRRAMAWTAIAATLLVAVTYGVMQRNQDVPINRHKSMAKAPIRIGEPDQVARTVPTPSARAEANIAQANDPNTLTLWVHDESGQRRPVRVPLMDAEDLGGELAAQLPSSVPAEVRSQLQDRGYQVQSKRRFAPFWLENGQRMIVPVEDTKIVPVSQNVY